MNNEKKLYIMRVDIGFPAENIVQATDRAGEYAKLLYSASGDEDFLSLEHFGELGDLEESDEDDEL